MMQKLETITENWKREQENCVCSLASSVVNQIAAYVHYWRQKTGN